MDLLKKLSSIDIKDLQKIDYKKTALDLKRQPIALASTAIILASVCLAGYLFTSRQKETARLKSELANLEQKITAIEKYTKTQEDLKNFIQQLPAPITEDEAIRHITDIAVKNDVRIGSYNPIRKQNFDLHAVNSIMLNVQASDYKRTWSFIHDLEESPYAVRIETLLGNMQPPAQPGDTGAEIINLTLEISYLNVKHE